MGSRKLRIMTYLAPGLPLDFFDLFRDYLEKETGINSYIIYESRWSGPPLDRKDPFTADEADIGKSTFHIPSFHYLAMFFFILTSIINFPQ